MASYQGIILAVCTSSVLAIPFFWKETSYQTSLVSLWSPHLLLRIRWRREARLPPAEIRKQQGTWRPSASLRSSRRVLLLRPSWIWTSGRAPAVQIEPPAPVGRRSRRRILRARALCPFSISPAAGQPPTPLQACTFIFPPRF